MKSAEEIKKKIEEIKSDERYDYPPASVFSNAPLALIQISMKSAVQELEWVMENTVEK